MVAATFVPSEASVPKLGTLSCFWILTSLAAATAASTAAASASASASADAAAAAALVSSLISQISSSSSSLSIACHSSSSEPTSSQSVCTSCSQVWNSYRIDGAVPCDTGARDVRVALATAGRAAAECATAPALIASSASQISSSSSSFDISCHSARSVKRRERKVSTSCSRVWNSYGIADVLLPVGTAVVASS